jgi:hypothetical protein
VAKQIRKGVRVMQMVVSDEEFKSVIKPKLKASGLSESSFLRERCELSVRSRTAGAGAKKSSTKGSSKLHRIVPTQQSNRAFSAMPSRASTLPFAGHRTDSEDEGNEARHEEVIDNLGTPAAANSNSGNTLDQRAQFTLDLSDELSLLAEILPVDQSDPE